MSAVGRWPMYAVTATGRPCPLPWSAVLGAMERHEGWNERRFRASVDAALSKAVP